MSVTEIITTFKGAAPPRSGYRRRGSAPNLRIVCDAPPPPVPPLPTAMHLFRKHTSNSSASSSSIFSSSTTSTSGSSSGSPTAMPSWLHDAVTNPDRVERTFDLLGSREDRRRLAGSRDDKSVYGSAEGKQPQNYPRSRYTDIIPYDATRVKLPARPGGSDFINASWIQEPDLGAGSSQDRRRWIASQGPLPETLHDFLSLFTDLGDNARPHVIVQLTACYEHSRPKSAPYVPQQGLGSSLVFEAMTPSSALGDHFRRRTTWTACPDYTPIRVTLRESREGMGGVWTENVLVVEKEGSATREVRHLECRAWADHGVPSDVGSILAMLSSAESAAQGSPIVVHCSAGVGRTGTLIAIGALKRHLAGLRRSGAYPVGKSAEAGLGDLPAEMRGDPVALVVDRLRDQRVAMVQTPEQLEFIYQAVAALWTSTDASSPPTSSASS